MTPFNMTMGIMACYISAGIAYNLAQSYKIDAFPCSMLSLMTFLLIAAPMKDGTLPASFMVVPVFLPQFWSAFMSPR